MAGKVMVVSSFMDRSVHRQQQQQQQQQTMLEQHQPEQEQHRHLSQQHMLGEEEEEADPESPPAKAPDKQRSRSSQHCCDRCGYMSPHKHAIERHTQAVHDRLKLYECSSCAYKTSHGSAFKRHIAKIHNRCVQETFSCDTCDYQTLHKSALKRHQAQKHNRDGLVSYKCSACDYSSTYEFALGRHMSTVHLKQGALGCPLCDYSTVHKQSLERHVKVVHEKVRSHACHLCEYRSAHRAALKMHVATVHDSKEAFRCETCGFETLYKTALARHKSTVTCGSGCKGVGAGNLMKQEDNSRTTLKQERRETEEDASCHRRAGPQEDTCGTFGLPDEKAGLLFAVGPEERLAGNTEEGLASRRRRRPKEDSRPQPEAGPSSGTTSKEIHRCVVLSGPPQEGLSSSSNLPHPFRYSLQGREEAEGSAAHAHQQYTSLAVIQKDDGAWQQVLPAAERGPELHQMVEISGFLQEVLLHPTSTFQLIPVPTTMDQK